MSERSKAVRVWLFMGGSRAPCCCSATWSWAGAADEEGAMGAGSGMRDEDRVEADIRESKSCRRSITI